MTHALSLDGSDSEEMYQAKDTIHSLTRDIKDKESRLEAIKHLSEANQDIVSQNNPMDVISVSNRDVPVTREEGTIKVVQSGKA